MKLSQFCFFSHTPLVSPHGLGLVRCMSGCHHQNHHNRACMMILYIYKCLQWSLKAGFITTLHNTHKLGTRYEVYEHNNSTVTCLPHREPNTQSSQKSVGTQIYYERLTCVCVWQTATVWAIGMTLMLCALCLEGCMWRHDRQQRQLCLSHNTPLHHITHNTHIRWDTLSEHSVHTKSTWKKMVSFLIRNIHSERRFHHRFGKHISI